MAKSKGNRKRKQHSVCRSVQFKRWQARRRSNRVSRISLAQTMVPLPVCQHGNISEGTQNTMQVLDLDKFPEDIFCHIHSLMPLRDAARAACVSHRFLRSWRYFPKLTFNRETFDLNPAEDETAKKLVDRIHHLLQNHSGIGVKTLKLQIYPCWNVITANHLDTWLQAGVKTGIVDLAVELPRYLCPVYNFSCSLVSLAASSLQSLSLSHCVFRPTLRIGFMGSLKSVCLKHVHITEEELGCFLSSTISLGKLEISECDEITFLKIPSHLQQLSFLRVFQCKRLQMIAIYAPKVTTFWFRGPPLKILFSDSSQVKCMVMQGELYSGMIQYARTKLHSIAPNVQDLTVSSSKEAFSSMPISAKFLQLRKLTISFSGWKRQSYDFLSLASFLEACPVLESFVLSAGEHCEPMTDSILQGSNAESEQLRQISEFHHDNLKRVSIIGFCSSKSLVELTCHILENAALLKTLVIDTAYGFNSTGVCQYMSKESFVEALNGVEAVKRYVEGKVPSGVSFKLWEPCSQCHPTKF